MAHDSKLPPIAAPSPGFSHRAVGHKAGATACTETGFYIPWVLKEDSTNAARRKEADE